MIAAEVISRISELLTTCVDLAGSSLLKDRMFHYKLVTMRGNNLSVLHMAVQAVIAVSVASTAGVSVIQPSTYILPFLICFDLTDSDNWQKS